MDPQDDLLKSDFEQCFEQMRHYDDSFSQTLQFVVAGMVSVVTACAFLLGKYPVTRGLLAAAAAILVLAALAGTLLVSSLLRNRVYFTRVCRYVNEVRRAYLGKQEAFLSNEARIYTNPNFPRAYSPESNQFFQVRMVILCLGALFGLGCAAAVHAATSLGGPWVYVPVSLVALLSFDQVNRTRAVAYLVKADAEKPVWTEDPKKAGAQA